MANTVLINRVVRQPGNLYVEDYLHSGVNQQSRLVKISVDGAGSLQIPHTLTFHPKWIEMAECKAFDKTGALVNLPSLLKDQVWLQVQEQDVADAAVPPNVGGVGGVQALTFALGGNPSLGTGVAYVYCQAPNPPGTTDYVYFTFHLGRTHSSPK